MDEIVSSGLMVTSIAVPIVLALGVVGCVIAPFVWFVRRSRKSGEDS
jgi:hypothetical protein